MKKFLVMMNLLIVAIGSFAQSFTVDGLTYSILSETDQTVELTSGNKATGGLVVPESITLSPDFVSEGHQGGVYRVTSIGNQAFFECSSLTSVSLPAATSIGEWAFGYCSSLTSVSLPVATSISSYAFYECSSLTSVSLPAATSISSYAFYECSSLTSVSLPAATSIGGYAFYPCSNISSLRIGSVEQWCKVNFGGDYANPLQNTSKSVDLYIGTSETPATNIVVPNTVTEIPACAFRLTTIKEVSAGSATSIGGSAFSGCSSLVSVSLPAATSIGRYAFKECSNINSLRIGSVEQWCKVNFGDYACPMASTSKSVDLYIGTSETPATNIVVPNTVTEIPAFAFRRTTIKEVSAEAATSIGKYAFQYCSSLASVSLPAATSIGENAFKFCSSLTSISLPAATSIGYQAFYGCSSLASVSLPAATSIGEWAFYGCSSLASVSLPKATSIGGYAFNFCSSLASVSLPAVTSIGERAFYDCSSLASVSLPKATSISSYAFYCCSNISSLRIGSVEQWCKVNFGEYEANPLQCTSKSVDLYIGTSETPATNIVVPNTVTEIPERAFRHTTIKEMSAGSATSIGGSAFYGCSSLASVSLPAATSISSYAFYCCSNISSLRIGSVEQWCKVNFGGDSANPLYNTSKSVDLYIGTSETPTTNIVVPNTVTEIPANAFKRTTIKEVSAEAATSIAYCAFTGCSSLASVSLPEATSIGGEAFSCCSSLASVSLPEATSIGGDAFYECKKIGRLELPKVKEIGSEAFSGMSALKYLSIPMVEKIGDLAFIGTYVDTLRIGSVKQYCNINYQNKTTSSWNYQYQFPFWNGNKTTLYIGDSNTPATEITIPEGVQQIPDYAFKGTDIHTVHFVSTTPPSLINTNSFPSWTMLAVPDEAYETYLAADVYKTIPLQITKEGHIKESVEVEASSSTSQILEKIGEKNVGHVINLKVKGTINSYDMLIIRNQMTSLRNLDLSEASIVDCDYIYSNTGGTNYHSVKDEITGDWLQGIMNLKLPSTVKAIGSNAFKGCTSLVSVNIPDGVTSIGSYAFYYCNRLKDLRLPQSVTSVRDYAFYRCTGLKEVSIPDGVTSINSYAFYCCTDLEKVTIPASVTSIGYTAFRYTRPIELHISSLESWMDVQVGYSWDGVFSNVAKLFVGDSPEPVDTLTIPDGTKEIKYNTFRSFTGLKSLKLPAGLKTIGQGSFGGCTGLTEISLPKDLTTLGDYAFSDCSNIEDIAFADSLKTIGSYAFGSCSKLTKIELPAYLETIGSYAFSDCSNLSEVIIPASIREIQDYAFQGCSSMDTVVATTVEPIRINQNTFSTYQTATLYTPKPSYYKYYWNTQWNQFLAREEYQKDYSYKYFYLYGRNGDNREDFELNGRTGFIHGIPDEETGEEKAPDADFYEGAGFVVRDSLTQELGTIHLHNNGDKVASIIAADSAKVHINDLYVDINIKGNRWYFFCFPFDIERSKAAFPGSHVWYRYDGDTRALEGNGGWKKVAADGVMQAGNGYIFQGAKNGTLTIHVPDVTVDTCDTQIGLKRYPSENINDASWNLIGNSNLAYYDLDNLDYGAPITVYNNETGNYEAVRTGDDDYLFYPFQAFFVQKPESTDSICFAADKKATKNMADHKKTAANAPMHNNADVRQVINLEIASTDIVADSVATLSDRTRIVLNPEKSLSYEADCDAAKFIAMNNIPQIYSVDDEGCTYAINERPVGNGIVRLAVKAPKAGSFTLSAPRLDCDAILRDLETGVDVNLAEGGYTFAAEATTYKDRFLLILTDVVASVEDVKDAANAIAVKDGTIEIIGTEAVAKVYTIGGVLVASQKGAGLIQVPAGVYVVVVDGKSTKVTVK